MGWRSVGVVSAAVCVLGATGAGPRTAAARDVQPARPAPAAAPGAVAASYGPPVRLLVGLGGLIEARGDGSVWALGREIDEQGSRPDAPAGRMVLSRRAPDGPWVRVPLGLRGVPLALAVDRGTARIVFSSGFCPRSCDVRLATLTADEQPSVRLLDRGMTHLPEADLVARAGDWWAAWTHVVHDPVVPGRSRAATTARLLTAGSSSPGGPHVVVTTRHDGERGDSVATPALALRGRGALLSFVRAGSVRLWRTASSGHFRPLLSLGPADGPSDLVTAGGGTLLAYRGAGQLVLAQDRGDLVFTRRRVPVPHLPSEVSLAASGGRVFVGYSAGFVPVRPRLSTSRSFVAEAGIRGGFVTQELSAPLASAAPGIRTRLRVTAARGRPSVLLVADAALHTPVGPDRDLPAAVYSRSGR